MQKNLSLYMLIAAVLLVGCGDSKSNVDKNRLSPDEISKMYRTVEYMKDINRSLRLTDSLYRTGNISNIEADFRRGNSYSFVGQLRTAEFYWKKAMAPDISTSEDLSAYCQAAASLANSLVNKGDYEGALRAALPAVKKMEESNDKDNTIFGILLESIGRCQLNLGRTAEAAKSYNRAYKYYVEANTSDKSTESLRHIIVDTHNTALSYLTSKNYQEALVWTNRTDSSLVQYEDKYGTNPSFIDQVRARIHLHRAIAYQGMGREALAAEAYKAYQGTKYGKSDDGRIDATTYLVAAKRFNEAVSNYQNLDHVLNGWGIEYSLNNIERYLFPKYRANVSAGRKDSAIVIASQILDVLDSAIVRSKNNDAAELATIYDTQQKEAEIARQQISLTQQRFVGTAFALVLITAFFIAYTLYRRRSERQLANAHAELKKAFEKMEKMNRQIEQQNEH